VFDLLRLLMMAQIKKKITRMRKKYWSIGTWNLEQKQDQEQSRG